MIGLIQIYQLHQLCLIIQYIQELGKKVVQKIQELAMGIVLKVERRKINLISSSQQITT